MIRNRHLYTHAVVALILGLAVSACNQAYDWALGPGQNLSKVIDSFGKADRMVIKHRDRDQIQTETRDPMSINEVVNFFKRYPSGWVGFSGAGGDYDIFLYQGDQQIGRLGLTASSRTRPGEDTLNIENQFRRVPASDLSTLASRLQLPWPLP